MLRSKSKHRKVTRPPRRIPLPADTSAEPKPDEYTTSMVPVVIDGFVREEIAEPFRESTGEMHITNALLIAQFALDIYHLNAGDLRYAAIYRKVYNGQATDFEADVEVIMLALEDEIKRRGESGDSGHESV